MRNQGKPEGTVSLGLYNHPLTVLLLEDNRPIISEGAAKLRELIEKEGITRYRGQKEFPERQYYMVMSFQRASRLVSAVDILERIEQFIRWLPPAKRFRELGISQDRWIDYHYSYHLVIMSSLLDLSLLLTNEILRLGYADRLCTYEAIKTNYWVRRYGVSDALAKLDRVTKRPRELRNSFVHHGEAPDIAEVIDSPDYDSLTFVAHADAMSSRMSNRPIAGGKLFDEWFGKEIEKVCSVIERERRTATETVAVLFDAVLPVYKSQLAAMQST